MRRACQPPAPVLSGARPSTRRSAWGRAVRSRLPAVHPSSWWRCVELLSIEARALADELKQALLRCSIPGHAEAGSEAGDGQMAGLSSSNAVANLNSDAVSTASS